MQVPEVGINARRAGEMAMRGRSLAGNRGFTLIELLIVVAIIGILASIAIPQFSAYRQKSFNVAAQSDIKIIKIQLESYYGELVHYPY